MPTRRSFRLHIACQYRRAQLHPLARNTESLEPHFILVSVWMRELLVYRILGMCIELGWAIEHRYPIVLIV